MEFSLKIELSTIKYDQTTPYNGKINRETVKINSFNENYISLQKCVSGKNSVFLSFSTFAQFRKKFCQKKA